MKSILQKLKCFLGKHDWLYNNERCNDLRECQKCRQLEQYRLTDFGRCKEWIPDTTGGRMARENREQCNSLTSAQRSELLSKAVDCIDGKDPKPACCDMLKTVIMLDCAKMVNGRIILKLFSGDNPANYCPWCGQEFTTIPFEVGGK